MIAEGQEQFDLDALERVWSDAGISHGAVNMNTVLALVGEVRDLRLYRNFIRRTNPDLADAADDWVRNPMTPGYPQ